MRLAFGHAQRSGKDTSADYVRSRLATCTQLSFAAPVYAIAYGIQDALGIPRYKDRDLLQFIGGGLRKLYGADVWCNMVEEQLRNTLDNVIVADVRHINEADMLRQHGFTLINVVRSHREITGDPNHDSETALNGYPYYNFVVTNDGTIEELYAKLDDIMAKVVA